MVLNTLKERKNPFLLLQVFFSVVALIFAIRLLLNPILGLNVVIFQLSIGIIFVILGIELKITGKLGYFVLSLIASVIAFSSALFIYGMIQT